MNILFYVNPWTELKNPKFRFGAVKNVFLKQVEFLAKTHSVKVLIGEGPKYYLDTEFQEMPEGSELIVLSYEDLNAVDKSYQTGAEKIFLEEYSEEQFDRFSSVISKKVGFEPDYLITWESPMNILEKMYPSALPVYLMPGMVSRLPYPDMMSMDFQGLFSQSTYSVFKKDLLGYEASKEELDFVGDFRNMYLENYWNVATPANIRDVVFKKEFKRYVLLPLQVSNYFSFDLSCEYKDQYEFLVDVLERIDPDVGVVVTQYVTPHTSDRAITGANENYLRNKYKNLIYSAEFNKVDSISQYLLNLVDGVISVSSALGFQAALYQKPLFTVGNSQLSLFSEGVKLEDIGGYFESGSYQVGKYDAPLSFILGRMQPLNSYMFQEEWFEKRLSDALAKFRKGDRGLSLYEPIGEDGYFDQVLASNRIPRAKQLMKMPNPSQPVPPRRDPLKTLFARIADDNIKYVSFDIFDTLVVRPFTKPIDIFRFIEPDVVALTSGKISSFTTERVAAEQQLRKELPYDVQEIHVEDIFDSLADKFGLTDEEKTAIMLLETNTELEFLYRREGVIKLFEFAKKVGKKVIIISDMYLDQSIIEAVLDKNGIYGYEKLYLSSSIGLRKHEGDLFKHVLNEIGIEPSEMIHVGDNPHGDIKRAEEKGIKTIEVTKGMDLFFKNKKTQKLFWDKRNDFHLGESAIIGLVSNKFYNDPYNGYSTVSHFNREAYNLGYFGMGWKFIAFTKWIIEESIKDGMTDLYFLARDGEVIKKVYDILAPHYEKAPKSHYLLGSRRSIQVASLKTKLDIIEMGKKNFQNTTIGAYLEKRFGVVPKNVPLEALKESGFESLDESISIKADQMRVLLLLDMISDMILESAAVERKAYEKYLKEERVGATEKQAIVDIGYAGTMQKGLINLLDLKTMGGYYFITFITAKSVHLDGHLIKGFSGDFVDTKHSWHPISNLGFAFEVVFSNLSGSFVKMTEEGGRLVPVLESVVGEDSKHNMIVEMQRGLVDITTDFSNKFGRHMAKMEMDNFGCMSVYIDFLKNPDKEDVRIMEGVTFDDSFGGADVRYMVPPVNAIGDSKEILRKSIWKEGTSLALNLNAQRNPSPASKPKPTSQAKAKPKPKKNQKKQSKFVRKINKLYDTPGKFFKDARMYKLVEKLVTRPKKFCEDSKFHFLNDLSKKM